MKNVYNMENGLNKLTDGGINPTYDTAQLFNLCFWGFYLELKVLMN